MSATLEPATANGAAPDEANIDGDVLADLRALRDRVLAEATKEIAVPGYGGGLVIRYRPPEAFYLGKVRQAILVGEPDDGTELDLIVAACDEILIRDHGKLRPIVDDGRPVRFDKDDRRLADALALRFPFASARDMAAQVFMVERQPLAPMGHFAALLAWLQGLESRAEARAEENSNAAAVS